MATPRQYVHEDVAAVPPGWKVRTESERGGTKLRIAYPPGRRKRGTGKLISILHPVKGSVEGNPKFISHAKSVRQGGGLFGFRKPKEYWETQILGKSFQVRRAKLGKGKRHRLPLKVDIDTATGEVIANPKKLKVKTREQVEKLQAKAVKFLRNVVRDADKAAEIADMSLTEYAKKKGITLSNPRTSAHGKRFRELHRRVRGASERAGVPVQWQLDDGGRPLYIIDGAAMTGREALRELDNRLHNPGDAQGLNSYIVEYRKPYGHGHGTISVEARNAKEARRKADAILRVNENGNFTIKSVRRAGSNPGGAHACKSYPDKCVPASQMAFVGDPRHPTTWALRIDNASHVRDAMARFSRTKKIPRKYRRAVAEELHNAAKKFGIDDRRFAGKYLGIKNPRSEASAAEGLYETFHQEPVKEVLEFQQDVKRREDYAVLGAMYDMVVRLPKGDMTLDFEDEEVLLASNPAGTQMYFIGGNQNLDDVLRQYSDQIHGEKDFVEIGKVTHLTYMARKEFNNYEMVPWEHKMGEKGGTPPILMYDKLNRQMYLVGGTYLVKYEGIIH